jgi:hypothetical protein
MAAAAVHLHGIGGVDSADFQFVGLSLAPVAAETGVGIDQARAIPMGAFHEHPCSDRWRSYPDTWTGKLGGPPSSPERREEMAKTDLKRDLKILYTARQVPTLVEVPELAYLMVDGAGDPNTAPEYREAVEVLYAVSYAAKFALKTRSGLDYTVMPLEGLWWADDPAKFVQRDKSDWQWTAMILQPDQVDSTLVTESLSKASKKGPLPAGSRLRLQRWTEGRAAQILHVGPYAGEGPTIARLHEFIEASGLRLTGKHHEIYLGDPRRTAPERLKTIIRQPVA